MNVKNTVMASRWLAGVLAVLASTVLVAWGLDIDSIKSIHPNFVTMKALTAQSFAIASAMFYFLSYTNGPKQIARREGLAAACAGWLFLSISFSLAAYQIGHDLLLPTALSDATTAVMTVRPGMPSLGTVFGFVLVSIYGYLAVARTEARIRKNIPLVLHTMCGLAILGYIIGNPALYSYNPDASTAMALHTAIYFSICAILMQLDSHWRKITGRDQPAEEASVGAEDEKGL